MNTQKKISADDVKTIFSRREDVFCRYQSLKSLDDMCRERCFFTRRLADQNDGNEQTYYGEEKFVLFPLCFCRSDNEKLPLWLVYGNVDFNGVRMRITNAKLRDLVISIINGKSKVFASEERNNNVKCTENELIYGKDIEIVAIGSVGYRQNRKKAINYKNKWYTAHYTSEHPYIEVKKEKIDLKYLYKEYIWVHEKEFRVVFKLIGEKAKIKNLETDGITGIGIKWSDELTKNIKIMLSPNESDTAILKQYDNITKLFAEKTSLSDYAGQLKIKQEKDNSCLLEQANTDTTSNLSLPK